MIPRETILTSLKRLRLSRIAEILDDEVEAALQESRDPLAFLGRLMLEQLRVNDERRIARLLAAARLPDIKTLDTFDWDFQPTLDRARVLDLARLEFIGRKENILFAGNSGTGKSHLAKSIAARACGAGLRVRFTTCEAMFRDLFSALSDHTLPQRLKRYTLPELLLIDDLGFEQIEITEAGNANLLLKVINSRYEKSATIITSNVALDRWGEYLKDPVLAMAVLDRFVHHAALVNIDGPSYREHQSRKMNQLRPAEPPAPLPPPSLPARAKTQPLHPRTAEASENTEGELALTNSPTKKVKGKAATSNPPP
jgi:DNA replication protein DnaC